MRVWDCRVRIGHCYKMFFPRECRSGILLSSGKLCKYYRTKIEEKNVFLVDWKRTCKPRTIPLIILLVEICIFI
jgi:hypothetical protein